MIFGTEVALVNTFSGFVRECVSKGPLRGAQVVNTHSVRKYFVSFFRLPSSMLFYTVERLFCLPTVSYGGDSRRQKLLRERVEETQSSLWCTQLSDLKNVVNLFWLQRTASMFALFLARCRSLRSWWGNSRFQKKSTKFTLNTHTDCKNVRKYFRTRPRAVAARIDLKLRHVGVHYAADALTKELF